MTGVILCGGWSTRMGHDKGLSELNGISLVQRAEGVLKPYCDKIFVSIRSAQEKNYEALFSKESLVYDHLSLNIEGPLLGILSSHYSRPDQDLFVIACDMPLMSDQLIQVLFKKYTDEPDYEVYCYGVNQFPEPLLAIYSARLLKKTIEKLNAGNLHQASAARLILDSKKLLIPLEKELPNLNSKNDLDRIRWG